MGQVSIAQPIEKSILIRNRGYQFTNQSATDRNLRGLAVVTAVMPKKLKTLAAHDRSEITSDSIAYISAIEIRKVNRIQPSTLETEHKNLSWIRVSGSGAIAVS